MFSDWYDSRRRCRGYDCLLLTSERESKGKFKKKWTSFQLTFVVVISYLGS